MVDCLVKFDEDQVINTMNEVYNDGRIQFFNQRRNLKGYFFHLQLSIRLVEDDEKLIEEIFRFHFGQSDPRFEFRFLY